MSHGDETQHMLPVGTDYSQSPGIPQNQEHYERIQNHKRMRSFDDVGNEDDEGAYKSESRYRGQPRGVVDCRII